ncbi:Integrator complex subunit 4, partial [Entomortierella beljakovae]
GLYGEMTVQNPLATQIQATRLVDDAFIRICDMVNDSSMVVRAKACSKLGQFKSVDYKFLSQTFSKQIMARLRVDIAPKNLAAGPAQKQAMRAKLIATPEGDQDVTAQQVRLLDSGACGAFVHGLEDEYQDVRNAAIDSIRELCLLNPEFSLLALDYMVDMFMDEIDYVRLNALTSLCKIGRKAPIVFDTEQLQIALGVLEDADRDEIPCPGTQPLQDLASALTMTITNDTSNDMEVENSEGNQPNEVSSAYATTIAAMRIQTERDAEEFYEVALRNVDRTWNAWRQNQRLRISNTGSNHYALLLQQIGTCQRDLRYIINVHTRRGENAEFVNMYLECCNILVRIQESYDTPSFIVLAPALSARLFRLSYYMDHTFLGVNATAKISVGCFRVMANLVWFFGMVQRRISGKSTSGSSSSNTGVSQIDQGLTKEYLQSMLQLAIKRITDLISQMDHPEVDLNQVQRHRILLNDLRIAMIKAFKNPSTPEIIKLMSNIVRFIPMEVDFGNLNLQRIAAHVTKPSPNRDNPIDIHPTFPFLVNIEGTISNTQDTAGIAIQVTLPDDVVRHYYPPPDHFTRVTSATESNTTDQTETYRLRTSIEIYPDAAWGTAPTELRISLSRSFQPDLTGHDEFICRFAEEIEFKTRQQQNPSQQTALMVGDSSSGRSSQLAEQEIAIMTLKKATNSKTSGSSASNPNTTEQSTLELSKSVSYFIARRNIFT